ncbi:MAG: hypothetical protein HXY52_03330 [Nitrospirae bacterium]|jgi:tetratricopeptide (TPR) repeat protein|nr:hypothetical protein [Nitrospirota bacterium]
MNKKQLIPEEELKKLLNQVDISDSIKTLIKEADELFRDNKLISAQEKLSNALDFIPDNLHLLNAYGNLLLHIGEPEYAAFEFVKIAVFDKNFALNHLNPDALLLVAENYLKIDDPVTASLIYKRVLEIEPYNEKAKQQLEIIQT